jgi:hypothetical protein
MGDLEKFLLQFYAQPLIDISFELLRQCSQCIRIPRPCVDNANNLVPKIHSVEEYNSDTET